MTISAIEFFCKSQQSPSDDWLVDDMPITTKQFLNKLNLSLLHPFCEPDYNTIAPYYYNPFEIPGIPTGPLQVHDIHDNNIWDEYLTIVIRVLANIRTQIEMWFRLISPIVAMIGIIILLYMNFRCFIIVTTKSKTNNNNNYCSQIPRRSIILLNYLVKIFLLLSLLASLVMMADKLYILNFGLYFGVTLFVLSWILSLRLITTTQQSEVYNNISILSILSVLLLVSSILVINYCIYSNMPGHFLELPRIREGLYHNGAANPFIQSIVDNWTYKIYNNKNDATPWLFVGDSRTAIPYLFNKPETPSWTRLWWQTNDGEVIGLDISFPKSGHDFTKPIYLVISGMIGGSSSEYTKDFALRANIEEHSTVAVLINRGYMNTIIRGWNGFHAARVSDIHEIARQLRYTLGQQQLVVGVGFSIGGSILGNYIARSGLECLLDAAISISGALDLRNVLDDNRVMRTWSSYFTEEAKDIYLHMKGERIRYRLSDIGAKQFLRATTVNDLFELIHARYNGFQDIYHYYSEVSVLGDNEINHHNDEQQFPKISRVHNISVPFCVIFALDDPVLPWRTNFANTGPRHPENLTKTGKGNLFVLVTKSGGHIGWPLGWNIRIKKWHWLSNNVMSFVNAVQQARKVPQRDLEVCKV